MTPRWLVRALDLVNRKGKSAGVRLVRYTGKSRDYIHPKHLVDTPWHDWYVEHLRPTDTVVDVGCAHGAHTLQAAARCRRIVGFDYDVGHLVIARRTARERGLAHAHFFAWDVTRSFPFADGVFDAALFLDVIEHLVPRTAVLREIHRVLKPGGRLLFMEHVRSDSPRWARWQDRLNRPWRAFAEGCNCNRATLDVLARSPLGVSDVEHGVMPAMVPLIRPLATGSATA